MNSVMNRAGIMLLVAVVAVPAWGAPKGKPFVELQGQIIEVQGEVSDIEDQVAALVDEVETIEELVVANGDAIATLETANANLQALVATSATDIASIQTAIGTLQSETTVLQQQVAGASGDVSALEQQIAHNQALIVNLQSALAAVQNGLISFETDLQAQIDQNTQSISALQYQIDDINSILALKQNHLNGQCSAGYALQAVNPDGSIFCTSISGGALESAYTEVMFGVNNNQHRIVSVACPAGYLRTGGGFKHPYFIHPTRLAPLGADSMEIGAVNWDPINNVNFGYAFCMRIAP